MLSEEELLRLISQKTETKNLEFKGPFLWKGGSDETKLGVIKDILAMANTQDGGRIIIGVEDGTYIIQGLSDEQWESFDQTSVNNLLHSYTTPQHTCQVFKTSLNNLKLVIIEIPEFMEIPIICQKNASNSTNPSKLILRSGDIYIRTEKATSESIRSADDMRKFLGRAIKRKGDDLLRSIHDIISGTPPLISANTETQYKKELQTADVFFNEKFSNRLQVYGSWKVRTYPVMFQEKRIIEFSELDSLVRDAAVDMSGWPFPYTDRIESHNVTGGRQSFTDNSDLNRIEGYRVFLSGHFVWQSLLWESLAPPRHNLSEGTVLNFINAIFSITEYFMFMERFYSKVCPDESIVYDIRIDGTKDRSLISGRYDVMLSGTYSAKENSVQVAGTISATELRANWKVAARKATQQIFQLFNWNGVTDEIINHWQTRFLNRQF